MLRIYGASDDLVELEGIKEDEIDCFNRMVDITVGDPEIGGCVITMTYASDDHSVAVWEARIRQIDENVRIPWPVNIMHASQNGVVGYSVVVEIGCPEGTLVNWSKRQV